jgi:putative inorganic carbon (HCO3(-)) transporter
MRDIALTLVVLSLIPLILSRAWLGILAMAWIGYMNPHRLCYSFAFSFPFFSSLAALTLLAALISREPKRIPIRREVFVLLTLVLWMNVTYLVALNPQGATLEWKRTMPTMAFMFMTLVLINTAERIIALVWVIALSFALFGVKGAIFTVLTGGSNMVLGPESTFIEDNNHLAVALSMTIPLLRFLQLQTRSRILRIGLGATMICCAFSILATYSRAGFLSLGLVALVMWWNSRRKLLLTLAVPAVAVVLLAFMPAQWVDRMNTIKGADEDASTLGRFNAWRFAFELAKARPLTGGGFRSFTPELFYRFAPDPENHHAAHSIYFEMLGDHGFVGLGLFLAMLFLTLLSASGIRKRARGQPELLWATDLSAMIQTSLVVYMVGGASLSLAYFDLPYHLVVIVVACKEVVARQIQSASTAEPEPREDQAALPDPEGTDGRRFLSGLADRSSH